MKMLIFGGSGRTGQIMIHSATAAGWQVIAPTHAECDLLEPEAVSRAVLESGAAAVVNCAAISGLEACLDDPLNAHMVNAVAPAAMALACRHTGARFVHLSTDYVLEGHKPGLRDESSKCKPANTYGESKREGEQQVMEALSTALILRVSWVCGNPAKPAFVESMLSAALQGKELSAIADKYSLPTDAQDIARVILELLPTEAAGIVHTCAGGEPLSWHDCVSIALQTAVDDGALTAMPPVTRTTLAAATFFRAERPRHTAMNNARLTQKLGIYMPSAGETLQNVTRRYLQSLKDSH